VRGLNQPRSAIFRTVHFKLKPFFPWQLHFYTKPQHVVAFNGLNALEIHCIADTQKLAPCSTPSITGHTDDKIQPTPQLPQRIKVHPACFSTKRCEHLTDGSRRRMA
jgi:hypothetical protein